MKLSIITVNLNNVKGLQQTIDSVLCQTWTDFEWLIIDGGSTDGSRELIETTASSCSKISFWCSEPDKGIYNAMNKGIVKAKGDYLLFLNSGDCLVNSGTLENTSTFLNNDYEIIVGKIQNVDFQIREPFIAMQHLYKSSLPHQASFISKKSFDKYGFYKESLKIASDWEFFLRVLVRENSSFKILDLTISKMQEGGISSNKELSYLERDSIISQYYTSQMRLVFEYANTFPTVLSASIITRKMYSVLYYFALFIKKIKEKCKSIKDN